MKSSKFLLAAALACALPQAPAFAQQVAPMIFELAPSGERASTVVRLQNPLSHPITVEVVAFAREIAADGVETRAPADDDFMIFPPQSVIQPGATQSFRVRYIGSPQLDRTKMYVVSLNQLPVDTAEARQSMQFVVNFATSAYVTPPGSRADLQTVSVAPAASGKAVTLTVRNVGKRFAPLAMSTFTIRNAKGGSFSLTGEPLRQALGIGVVPAQGTRVFTLPAPAEFDATGPLTAAIRYDPSAPIG